MRVWKSWREFIWILGKGSCENIGVFFEVEFIFGEGMFLLLDFC